MDSGIDYAQVAALESKILGAENQSKVIIKDIMKNKNENFISSIISFFKIFSFPFEFFKNILDFSQFSF